MKLKAVVVAGLGAAVAVATGDVHSCALLANGSVKCWGSNFYGQLGNGSNDETVRPTLVSPR